jgi:hypothetical protein
LRDFFFLGGIDYILEEEVFDFIYRGIFLFRRSIKMGKISLLLNQTYELEFNS